MLTPDRIRKRIKRSIIVSVVLLVIWMIPSVSILNGKDTMGGAAFLVIMAGMSTVAGIICLIIWISMLVNPRITQWVFPIFMSVQTLIWGSVWFLITLLSPHIEDKVPLFFIWPIFWGIILVRKVIRSIHKEYPDD